MSDKMQLPLHHGIENTGKKKSFWEEQQNYQAIYSKNISCNEKTGTERFWLKVSTH